jgi:tellurite resistance protein TehA-like permease
MAVLVGLVFGFAAGFQRKTVVPFWLVLVVPLSVAALEIVVNADRFGVLAMALWSVILVILTIGAAAAAMAGGRWLSARRAVVE